MPKGKRKKGKKKEKRNRKAKSLYNGLPNRARVQMDREHGQEQQQTPRWRKGCEMKANTRAITVPRKKV
jgi:hypothetical protein